jgi:glucose 1-dehydrogenase
MNVDGKRILVTGSSRGIGKAIALEMAARGAVLVVHGSRESEALDASFTAVKEKSPKSICVIAPLSETSAIDGLFAQIQSDLGGLDVLINNAATQNPSPLEELKEEDWDFVMAVNLKAPFLCGQRAARMMINAGTGGRIVNISSVHSQAPRRFFAHYSSSKGGLEQLTRCMALEWADHKIAVNALTVGAIATELTPAERCGAIATAIPEGRVGDVGEVARLCAFLASEECGYITGECITIDGGLLLGFCASRRDL